VDHDPGEIGAYQSPMHKRAIRGKTALEVGPAWVRTKGDFNRELKAAQRGRPEK